MRVTRASSHRHAASSCNPSLALLLSCGLAFAALGCQEGAILPADAELPVAGGNVEGALIRDQYHGSGTVGFAFLAPIATRQPSSTSTFESRLSPEVRLEQLKSDGSVASTLATFTAKRSSSNADDAVRRNVSKEFYVLRLHSNRYNLDPKLTYRVRVLTGGVELGYADLDVVNNQSQANRVDRSQFVPLIRGRTLPIRFRIEKRAVDKDGDGVFDWLDNCPSVKNPPTSTSPDVARPTARASWRCNPDESACDPQEQDCNPATFKQPDSDGDGVGDACETCMPGFSGSPCTDIDECKQQPPVCDPLAQCTNTPGSYTCGACPAGYTGDGKAGCKDIDECAGTTPVCDSHVMCTNTPGSYGCGPCPTGFMGDGKTCTPTMTPPMGGLSLTTVTLPPLDDANYRNGSVTLGWAAPMAGQYASYQLHCSINPLDVTTADRVTQDLWWLNARNVPLPANFVPPANSVTLNLRVGEAANCVLRGVDAQGNLSAPTSSTPVQVPFRQHHIAPTAGGQSAGFDLAPVGDVDGDGIDDLLVGGQGSAYLVFGRAGGLTASVPDVVFAGDADSLLGYAVAGLGDFNGDGRNDFAIGAPGYRNSAGRVLVFFGRASRDWPANVGLSGACAADLCFENDQDGQALGSAVESAGDFNGDGANDLVFGALNYPNDVTASGRMYIVLGKAYESGQTKTGAFYNLAIATPSSSQLQGFVVTGDNTNLARLGFSVASLGNIDAAPGSELAVSALGSTSTTAKLLLLSGRPYALGSATGLTSLSLADFGARDANGTPSGTWFGSGAEEQFGYGVYAVGNVYDVPGANKPGAADLVVWSYGDPGFTVYPGDNGFADADKFYVGAANGTMSYLGSSVASSRGRGDLDGDGRSELCAGGERDPQSGATPGSGQLWYADTLATHVVGTPKTADSSASTTLHASTLASDAGPQVIEFAGDLNGDGKPDLVIGSPNSGNFSGELTVLY